MGVIYPLNRWVLTHAMQTIVALSDASLVSKVAVNLTSKELLQDELVEELELMFEQYQIKPQQLVLELKESALLADPERARIILLRLHRLGVGLALDDFGTGFSSLGYLRQLPIQFVKIDCSFISELDKSDMQSAITGAIIDIARNLGLSVIAEGIESAEVEDKLLRMGCQFGQGYFYTKPFELAGFPSWLAQWQQKATPRKARS
jgi:diguanylate cyclase